MIFLESHHRYVPAALSTAHGDLLQMQRGPQGGDGLFGYSVCVCVALNSCNQCQRKATLCSMPRLTIMIMDLSLWPSRFPAAFQFDECCYH